MYRMTNNVLPVSPYQPYFARVAPLPDPLEILPVPPPRTGLTGVKPVLLLIYDFFYQYPIFLNNLN